MKNLKKKQNLNQLGVVVWSNVKQSVSDLQMTPTTHVYITSNPLRKKNNINKHEIILQISEVFRSESELLKMVYWYEWWYTDYVAQLNG